MNSLGSRRRKLFRVAAVSAAFAGILAVVSLLAVWVFFLNAYEPTDCLRPEPDTLVTFPPEKVGGVEPQAGMIVYLPPGAHNIGSKCHQLNGISHRAITSALGMTLTLWFDIDADEMSLFLEKSQIDEASLAMPEIVGPPGPPPRSGGDPAEFLTVGREGLCEGNTPCRMYFWIETTEPVSRVWVMFEYGGD